VIRKEKGKLETYETEKENDEFNDYEKMFEDKNDDVPLLVFHYGTSLAKIKELLGLRKIILKNNEFVEISSLKFS
jgi:hypothetical protein